MCTQAAPSFQENVSGVPSTSCVLEHTLRKHSECRKVPKFENPVLVWGGKLFDQHSNCLNLNECLWMLTVLFLKILIHSQGNFIYATDEHFFSL